MASESGKDLSRLLGIKRVKPNGNYVPKRGHTVVNWGNSRFPDWLELANRRNVTILNDVGAVGNATNKLTTLRILNEARVNIPRFTVDKQSAMIWLEDCNTVIERHKLTGNSAEGIRVVNIDDPDMPSELNDAPLYTKFIPKSNEFRVHVFRGEIIDYREKKKRKLENRPENFNKYISSHTMGWVFCKNNIKHIDSVKEEAIKAVNALGLDFAAVDVIFYEGTPYVLEANTAPGIMGTTLAIYANTFRNFMGLPSIEIINDNNVTSEAVVETLDSGLVTLTLDYTTARKLKALLADV